MPFPAVASGRLSAGGVYYLVCQLKADRGLAVTTESFNSEPVQPTAFLFVIRINGHLTNREKARAVRRSKCKNRT